MADLNTRIVVDNSKHLADEGKSLPLSELLSGNDLRFKIDNSKDLADNFRSISLDEIKSILNNESVLGFDLNTRIVIDNSNASAHEDKTVLIEDVVVLVQPDQGGGSSYTAKAVHFADDTVLGLLNSILVDTSKITIVMQIRPTTLTDGNYMEIGDVTNMTNPVTLQVINDWNVTSDLALDVYDNTGSNEFTVVSNSDLLEVETWVGLFYSIDTDHAAGLKKGFIYKNGVDFLNALNDSSPAFSVGINTYSIMIPATSGGTHHAYDVADVQIWLGTFIDPSVNGNILKFVDVDGKPVDPAVAAAAFGQQTFLFSGDSTAFATNQGSGGACALTGTALTDASTSPSD